MLLEIGTIMVEISPLWTGPLFIKMCIVWDLSIEFDDAIFAILQITVNALQPS